MTPRSRAFLLSVIRYQTLRHRSDRPSTREYGNLEDVLSEPAVGALRPDYEQRSFRRMAFNTQALVRTRELDAPCTILDISGTGARIRDDAGLTAGELEQGTCMILRISPAGSTLRIDLPVEVVHADELTGTHGERFAGAPLVMQQRIQGTRDVVARDAVAEASEAPANDLWAQAA